MLRYDKIVHLETSPTESKTETRKGCNMDTIDMNKTISSDTTEDDAISSTPYDPNHLLDALLGKLLLKNDAALSRALEVAPPVISKIRHRRLPVGASLLIRMHEISEWSIHDLRGLMGDRRAKFRISDKQFKPKGGEGTAT